MSSLHFISRPPRSRFRGRPSRRRCPIMAFPLFSGADRAAFAALLAEVRRLASDLGFPMSGWPRVPGHNSSSGRSGKRRRRTGQAAANVGFRAERAKSGGER